MRRIGVHTSIAGGLHLSLERAHELGCTTLQIFSHNPRGWAVVRRGEDEIAAFKELREKYDLSPVVIHTSYLINLAARDHGLLMKSIDMTVKEMGTADEIGADFVVLHTGSASGADPNEARSKAAACLREVTGRGQWRAGLLLENTAGERGDITSRISELAGIIEAVPGNLISGICIDSCHAYSAGYEVSSDMGMKSLFNEIESCLGREKLKILHINDCKGALGSGRDRHEHIGKGAIGTEGFRRFLNHPYLADIPIILETPKKTDEDDPRNIKAIRDILF